MSLFTSEMSLLLIFPKLLLQLVNYNSQFTTYNMSDSIFILLAALILIPAAFIVLHVRHKKEIRKKNSGIFKHLDNEQHLKEELKRAKIEKETLMKVIKTISSNNV